MIKYFILLSFLRFGVKHVADTYEASTGHCNALLQKAKEATIESVRSAYCVEVVDADHKATSETLAQYKLNFLASNETYSTTEEVLAYSCRIPSIVETLLVWTAGVGPLTFFWMLHMFIKKFRQTPHVPVKELKEPVDTLEKPPIYPPKKSTTYVRDLYKAERKKEKQKETEMKKIRQTADTIIGTFGKVSPAIRKRILGTEP